MENLLGNCIKKITEESKIRGKEAFKDLAPVNPSMVINYNLDNETFTEYKKHLAELWPKIDMNLQYTDCEGDLEGAENKVRTNHMFEHFHEIHIHILFDVLKTDVELLFDYIKEKFSEVDYKVIIHAFLDYSLKVNAEKNEMKLIQLMKERNNRFQYLFVYSNKLNNGALWIEDESTKITRLMADITAIMMIDHNYFSDGNNYTFSYNILEKPTKKIVQFSLCCIIKNLMMYEYDEKLDKNIEKKFQNKIRMLANQKISKFSFKEEDFNYLPSNKALSKESNTINKSIDSFRMHYEIAAECFEAMLHERTNAMEKTELKEIDFEVDLEEILSFSNILGYLKESNKAEDLYSGLEGILLHKKQLVEAEGYNKFLADYANMELTQTAMKKVFDIFKVQFEKKKEQAEWLEKGLQAIIESNELIINALDKETNLEMFYSKIVDDYFASNRKAIIAKIDRSKNLNELIENLEYIILELYDSKEVFYMPFEEEIDERVGKNTAKSMFEAIDLAENVENNICFRKGKLQTEISTNKTADVVLLLNPYSNLKNHKITDAYHKMELSRQDCVERIDFHTLSYIGGNTCQKK